LTGGGVRLISRCSSSAEAVTRPVPAGVTHPVFRRLLEAFVFLQASHQLGARIVLLSLARGGMWQQQP